MSSVPSTLFDVVGVTLAAAGLSAVSPWAVLALVVVALAGAVWVAVMLRQRFSRATQDGAPAYVALRRALSEDGSGPRLSGGGLAAVVEAGGVVCPTCATEYGAADRYCVNDGRVLVSLNDLPAVASLGSEVCSTCERAYEQGFGECPFDGGSLVPIGLYESTRGAIGGKPATGSHDRYCPDCGGCYDLAAKFCPRDGACLEILN